MTGRRRRSHGGIVLAVIAAGCAAHTSDDPAVPRLVAEETLRIGSVDDPETSLTSFHALEVAPDGRIFTIHAQESLVRVHGPDGTPLGHIGREGEGPGEFLTPVGMGFRDGGLWVWDLRARRLSWFDADGEFLREETYSPRTPTGGAPRVEIPDGILGDGSYFGSEPVMARDLADGEILIPYFRLRPDGTVIDTIAMIPMGGGSMIIEEEDRPFYASQPFADSPAFALSDARMEIVFVDRTIRSGDPRFVVTRMAFGGDTLWSREYPFEPVTIAPSVVDSAVAAQADRAAGSGLMTRREAEAAIRDRLFRPPHYPAVRSVRLGRDGSVWLQMFERAPDSARWLVLREDGDILGEVELPERLRVITARQDEVWGMDLDELDVPYIVKYSVRVAGPSERSDP